MGNKFVNSAGLAPLAPYESTSSAALTLTSLLAGSVVGQDEIIWVKSDSTCIESTTAAVTLTADNTTAYGHPSQVVSTSDWDEAPTTTNSGATISAVGFSINLVGCWRFSGITFNSIQQNIASGNNGPHYQVFDNCTFWNTGASSYTVLGAASPSSNNDNTFCVFNNCTYRMGSTIGNRNLQLQHGTFKFNNLISGDHAKTPTCLFSASTAGNTSIVEVDNSDFSNTAFDGLFYPFDYYSGKITFTNCKFHPSTVVMMVHDFFAPGGELLLINCDSGNSHTRHERYGYEGIWKVTTTVYASTLPAVMDGTVNYSIQMDASANVSRNMPLYSQWLCVWNDGTAYTPSVEVMVLGATALTSDQLWLEVDYTSGTDSPLGTHVITCPNMITAGTTVASGTTAWIGDSSNAKHKLTSGTITPSKPGYIYMRVALGKPSSSIYVNPPR